MDHTAGMDALGVDKILLPLRRYETRFLPRSSSP